ncbi:etoposide-induced protein 2.4 homolog [Littorina saxatilis]|uniref:Uncharacterized protein n=1 Tax=Littorina saxatilis TaxID=31220 RepID=A0AAN9BHD9_9CAEN
MEAVQSFSYGFVKGFAENINFISTLIKEPENDPHGAPLQSERTPERTTELARRRVEKQRARGETPRVPKETVVGGNTRRAKLITIIAKNLLLSVTCILGVTHVIKPFMRRYMADFWDSTAERVIDSVLVSFWLGPMWLMIKLVNIFWMTDLANDAYKERRGRPAPSEVTMFFSDIVYTTILQLFFITQISLFSMLPVHIQGFNVFEVVLTTISYSLYSFEYKWMNMGYDVRKRLELVDKNVGYHMGFSFPLTLMVLCWDSFWVRFILYSIFFPFLIVCANDADEPQHRKGRTTHIFLLPERATHFCFWFIQKLVRTFGLKRAVNILIWLFVLVLVYYLGVIHFVLGLIPIAGMKHYVVLLKDSLVNVFVQIQETVLDWFGSS